MLYVLIYYGDKICCFLLNEFTPDKKCKTLGIHSNNTLSIYDVFWVMKQGNLNVTIYHDKCCGQANTELKLQNPSLKGHLRLCLKGSYNILTEEYPLYTCYNSSLGCITLSR